MLSQIRDYVSTHPWITAAVLYPVMTALVTGIFHARSPSEFANKPVRLAALYKLVAAVGVDTEKAVSSLLRLAFGASPSARAGALASLVAAMTIDPPKLLEALYQLVTGKRREDEDRPTPPLGPLAVVAGMALALSGCLPADVPRDQARATVLTIAKAVQTADIACAELAIRRDDIELAQTCSDAYDVARDALLGAESAIDAWDDAHRGDVACAAAKGVASLTSIAAAIERADGKVPAIVTDALTLAPTLVGGCRG